MRDVRFGTPRWTFDADWLWGSTPLVRLAPTSPPCVAGKCNYRVAPEALVSAAIDLSVSQQEVATVRLPDGTTLTYEPIHYDGVKYPAAPAGAATKVLGFRLASARDRNGYETCFRYRTRIFGPELTEQKEQGRLAPLEDIAYGRSPAEVPLQSCKGLFATSQWDEGWHRVQFEYASLTDQRYFSTWTVRFGAPVSFNDLLTRISTHARGAPRAQDDFYLTYSPAVATETRRPLLEQICQVVETSTPPSFTSCRPSTQSLTGRVVRSFSYGKRSAQYGEAEIVRLNVGVDSQGRLPPALAGTVSRPIRRESVFNNPNGLFQTGHDQDSDAAPLTHATTEQWTFTDLNGDGLPDLQWAKETGQWAFLDADGDGVVDPQAPAWNFETSLPVNWTFVGGGPLGPRALSTATRPPQQIVAFSNGIDSSGRMNTSVSSVTSHAATLENDYISVETPRSAFPVNFTAWIWGEGRSQSRTGMPMSISAPEIENPAPTCPRSKSQDPRRWPLYPDGTVVVSKGGVGHALFQLNLMGPLATLDGSTSWGAPPLDIITGIHKGYRPTFSVSANVSGWADDLNGDGVQEFVATPGWIERFTIEGLCATYTDPGGSIIDAISKTLDSQYARETQPALLTTGAVDKRWHFNDLPKNRVPTQVLLPLDARNGPAAPVGLPLSYETTTGSTEGFGATIPVGSLISTGISTIITPGYKWIPIAVAAPGLTVETFSPRTSGGYSLSIPAPSPTAILQGLGSTAASAAKGGADASSIAGFIMSLIRVNFDITVLSATSRSHSESRGQLLDINADGLPDYLLYNTGDNIVLGAAPDGSAIRAPRGSLVAYLNSPQGFTASAPLVINQPDADGNPATVDSKFAYAIAPPDADAIEAMVADLRTQVATLGTPLLATPDIQCSVWGPTCVAYIVLLNTIADRATNIIDTLEARPLLRQTTDAIRNETDQLGQLITVRDALRGAAASLNARAALFAATAGVCATLPTAVPGSCFPPTPMEISTETAAARTLAEISGNIVRTLRHIGHPSRINVIGQGFSMLGGQEPIDTNDSPDLWDPSWAQPSFGAFANSRTPPFVAQ
jgi:hypothetical protein